MRNILAAIILLISSGCGPYMNGTDYLAVLEYTPISANGWKIFTPEKNVWNSKYQYKSYLPQYFPNADRNGLQWGSEFNYFYAAYTSDSNPPLALWVRLPYALGAWKSTGGDFWGNRVESAPTSHAQYLCKRKCFGVEISTNAVDMNFDTQGVFMMKGDNVIRGDLAALNKGYLCKDTVYLNHDNYRLSDPKTIALMQFKRYPKDALAYPSFGFKFPLDCWDIENTTLVISGFTYKGKPIPPLKVRLNYTDLSQVPGYEGPPATQQAQ